MGCTVSEFIRAQNQKKRDRQTDKSKTLSLRFTGIIYEKHKSKRKHEVHGYGRPVAREQWHLLGGEMAKFSTKLMIIVVLCKAKISNYF